MLRNKTNTNIGKHTIGGIHPIYSTIRGLSSISFCFSGESQLHFHTAYLAAFPKKGTCVNVSTMEHAKFCFDESMGDYRLQHILCHIAAREGNLNGAIRMDVNGVRTLVQLQPKMDIWMSSNGVMRMVVNGIVKLVMVQPKVDIWMYSNGVVKMAVHGMQRLVHMLLKMDIWM
jgi:hypothetical protein